MSTQTIDDVLAELMRVANQLLSKNIMVGEIYCYRTPLINAISAASDILKKRSPELRPCVFCDSLLSTQEIKHAALEHFYVKCGCQARGPIGDTIVDAAEKWNEAHNRPTD